MALALIGPHESKTEARRQSLGGFFVNLSGQIENGRIMKPSSNTGSYNNSSHQTKRFESSSLKKHRVAFPRSYAPKRRNWPAPKGIRNLRF